MKTTIYCVTHKAKPLIINNLIIPFQVGNNPDILEGIIRDNILENISNKNDSYSELTACYWIWKNVKSTNYVGLCHYRRYFNFNLPLFNKKKYDYLFTDINGFKKLKQYKANDAKIDKKIVKILKHHDAIVTVSYNLENTVYEDYKKQHRIEDLEETLKIIKEFYPDYATFSQNFVNTVTKIHICNMFITSKFIWDDYHQWLFHILFELEKRINLPDETYQKRVFGFLSERLFNIYLYKKKLKLKEIAMTFVEA